MTDLAAQGTDDWIKARCGNVGASRIADIMARTKSGPSASRANYAAQLVAERLTGQAQESYTNAAMAHGIATEPEARAAYAFHADADVTETGFVMHPRIAYAGASPDGLVGADGLVEIKAPNTATHLATLLGAAIDDRYLKQMQFQMACTERAWCDYASYDPRLPEALRLHVRRVERDDAMIANIEEEVGTFLAEIDQTIAALRKRYGV